MRDSTRSRSRYPREDLRRHGLTLSIRWRERVRRRSLDMPGGSVKAESGEILLRTKGQAYRGEEFAKLTLLTRQDGSRLQLDDVARVVDGFEDADKFSWLDGKAERDGSGLSGSAMKAPWRWPGQSRSTWPRHRVGCRTASLSPPGGISPRSWTSRMNLLIKNGLTGLLLVFVVLTLFLRLRLALWVTIGIPHFLPGNHGPDARVRCLHQHGFPVLFHHGPGDRGGRRHRGWRECIFQAGGDREGVGRRPSREHSESPCPWSLAC